MDQYLQFKQDFLREFTNWVDQGRKKDLLVTIFYLRVAGDERSWQYMPKNYTGKTILGRRSKPLTPTVKHFFELKKQLAYVYLVDVVLDSNDSRHVDAALYHLQNTLSSCFGNLNVFPLTEIKAERVENVLKQLKYEKILDFLLSLSSKLPDPVDFRCLRPDISLRIVAERLRNRQHVPDLDYYVNLACENINYNSYSILIHSISTCDVDFTKIAKVLNIDEYRSGIAFQLSRRNITHFTDGWRIVFETLLRVDLHEFFALLGLCLKVPTFANEFIASDMFPEFLKQAVECSPRVACPDTCFQELKKIKGEDWFVNEIYVPNAHMESKWMDIMRFLSLNPENENVKREVIPRIFNILKTSKNVNWPLTVTTSFTKSRQFCDDNVHWVPVIFNCLSPETEDAVEECLGSFCKNTTNAKLIPVVKKLEEKDEFYTLSLELIVQFIQVAGSLDMFKRDKFESLIEEIEIDLEQYEPIEESSESGSEYDGHRGYRDKWGQWKYGKDPYRYEYLERFNDDIDVEALIIFVALCNDKKEYERLYPRMVKHFMELDNEILLEFALKSFGEEFKNIMLQEIPNQSHNWMTLHPKLKPYLIN